MRLTEKHIKQLVSCIFNELKEQNVVVFKAREEVAFEAAVKEIVKNMEQETLLDAEVHKMLDDLERQHGGEFERYKMYPMLKKRLAKEKGFVL